MKRYSIHIHTNHSGCGAVPPDRVLEIAKQLGFNGIAITDHNTITGALEVKRLNKDKDFEVIVGEEVSTDIGHVLVYYVKKEIPRGDVNSVVAEVRKQKALCVLAHPFNTLSSAIWHIVKSENMRRSIQKEEYEKIKLFDGIEAFNSRCLFRLDNRLAKKLAAQHNLPMTAGSDAHFENEMGNAWVEFDDSLTFKEALLKRKLILSGRRGYVWINKVRNILRRLRR